VPVLQVALAGDQGDLRATIELHQGDIDGIQAGFDNRSGEVLGVVHCQTQQFPLPGDEGGSDGSSGQGCHRFGSFDVVSLQGQERPRCSNCARLLGATWAGDPQER